MSDLIVPAPLWRRLAAAAYDALLLAGICAFGVLIATIISVVFATHIASAILWLWLFGLGFAFFGWSWTHGGQTLGMLAWGLKLRRLDGRALRWPIALLRYCAMVPSWLSAGLGVWWCVLDARGRALHDLAAGTEMVYMPKTSRE